MPRSLLTLFVAGLVTSARLATAESPVLVEGDTFHLPDMQVQVGGLTLKDFILPGKQDITPPDFPPDNPLIHAPYPGTALFEGVATGRATVGVMLDTAGQPLDFLLIRYTQDYFGRALLGAARNQAYTAKRLHGVAIPGVFTFSYHFEPPEGLTSISSFEAAARRAEEVGGGPEYVYQPHREEQLDAGQLELVRLAVPVLPARHIPPDKRPVKVLVSFYVDEQGRVRLPNVESAIAPELVAHAVAALQQWAFKPPTIRTKPVLVRAMRALAFREAPPATDK